MIILNFKTYETAVGSAAVDLAKICEAVSHETGSEIAVAVGALDLAAVAAAVEIPVFCQHVDAAGFGSFTGKIVPEVAKNYGAVGTLLNHSENRCVENLPAAVAVAKTAGLTTVVCVENPEEAEKFAAEIQPDFIAVEPPELIGGDISVTSANPEIISDSVARVGQSKLLVGAGVKNGEDVAIAVELGAAGVLLASGVTKAADPAAVLRDLATGFQK